MIAHAQLRQVFESAFPYQQYMAKVAKPGEAANWAAAHARVRLSPDHKNLLAGFSRKVNALCLSGTWCGDCVHQCTMLDHIAQASAGAIDLRFVERPAHPDLSEAFKVCGGDRVPLVIFLNEEFDFCGLYGDRTLSRYRSLAAKSLGSACPLPGAPLTAPEIDATLAEWVSEFERIHLMLRLSTKLRRKHDD